MQKYDFLTKVSVARWIGWRVGMRQCHSRGARARAIFEQLGRSLNAMAPPADGGEPLKATQSGFISVIVLSWRGSVLPIAVVAGRPLDGG